MPSYEAALAALEAVRLKEDTGNFAKLSALMVRACNRAITWNEAADTYEMQRHEDRQFVPSGAASMLATLTKILALADKDERAFDAISWRAVRATGITPDMLREVGYEHRGLVGGQGGQFTRALLIALRDQVKAETKRGAFIATFMVLCGFPSS